MRGRGAKATGDMLPFGVTIPATVAQRSEIPEGLMNYPVFIFIQSLEQGFYLILRIWDP
jgi:hypothetical protein